MIKILTRVMSRPKGVARLYWDSLLVFSDIGVPKSYNLIKISYANIQK